MLGSSQGVGCWAGVRDSTVILGPPGSGKGLHLVIPWIVDHCGPVITTSTRPDNLAVTWHARGTWGPVAVFDPQRFAPGAPSPGWTPHRGCESPSVAMQRAGTLVGESAGSEDKDGFWRQQTVSAVQCLLHACALSGGDCVDLYRWSVNPEKAREAVFVLSTNPKAQPGWSDALASVLGESDLSNQQAGVWSGVGNALAMLADPVVLAAVNGGAEPFDPVGFLRSHGTIYLLGTHAGGGAIARLIAAFVEDVVTCARQLAAASTGARLDPPLGLVLDEAANYPLPSLPSLMSEGGGSGLMTVAVLQSLSQARSRWGIHNASAVWDSATVKVVLGGGASADDLQDMSRLCGEIDIPPENRQTKDLSLWAAVAEGFKKPIPTGRTRPVLSPSDIRRLPFGTGILLLRTANPIDLRLTPWPDRPDARYLQASKKTVEEAIRANA